MMNLQCVKDVFFQKNVCAQCDIKVVYIKQSICICEWSAAVIKSSMTPSDCK